MPLKEIERQARYLAKENRLAEPDITHVYWFPDERQVRLVELTPLVPILEDDVVPFYFRAEPKHGLPAVSGIAMIRPVEYRKLRLPEGWGTWDDAVEITSDDEAARP